MNEREARERIRDILERLRGDESQEAFAERNLGVKQSQYSKIKKLLYLPKGRSLSLLKKRHPAEAQEIGRIVSELKGVPLGDGALPAEPLTAKQQRILDFCRESTRNTEIVEDFIKNLRRMEKPR